MASAQTTGQLAALCGFERMTRRRLDALLAGREPAHALAIASGEAEPTAAVAATAQESRRTFMDGPFIRLVTVKCFNCWNNRGLKTGLCRRSGR